MKPKKKRGRTRGPAWSCRGPGLMGGNPPMGARTIISGQRIGGKTVTDQKTGLQHLRVGWSAGGRRDAGFLKAPDSRGRK